jgi:RNA polymerase sigma-70 factor (ECF subfamily)
VRLLAEDAVLVSDGGGKATAALRPIEGPDRIARFSAGIYRKLPPETRIERVLVNGQPGLLFRVAGEISNVTTFEIADGRIREVLIIRNPDKLARVHMHDRP